MTESTTNGEHLALWGGRFKSGPSPELARLSKSTQFDWRLADDDIAGSRAHARALGRAGLLTADELQRMEDALDELQRRVDSGAFAPIEDDEDEATALERGLLQIAGDELGGKLRAGRSRNDQIAALIRMWLRRHSRVIAKMLLGLAATLTEQAEKAGRTVMPGRTHMQHAQPVLLAHQLMAHVWPLLRDVERLADWDKRIDASPYGSGALAGNTLGLEPVAVARELGFSKVTANSIDGTASRDLVAEFAFIAAMAGVDISRLSEEIIIWNTQEFAFVRLDDAYSTGSSIMPQKKNPDIAELARGKSGRLIGDLAGLLTTLKGLPTAYARDLQEDKEAVFDQVDTLEVLLPAFTGMVGTMVFNKERLEAEAPTGFALATDIAEWLVKNGVPFRHAHELSGACVKIAEDRGQELWDLADDDFIEVFKEFLPADKAPEVREVLSTEGSVSARNGKGGTSPLRVREQIVSAKTAIEQLRAFANSGIQDAGIIAQIITATVHSKGKAVPLTRTQIQQLVRLHGQEILCHEHMQIERVCYQHGVVTTFAHSIRVACLAVWIADRLRLWHRVDLHSLIRAALLHDYFLYDWHAHDGGRHRMHGFTHGGTAMRNAVRDFHLNRVERDSIENHMFPLTPIPPRYLEGYLVTVADKISATRETVSLERFYKPKVNMHTSGK